MEDARELHLGLIGLGNWARRLAGCIAGLPDVSLAACFSRSEDARRRFAAEVGAVPAPSLDALLADAAIDGVLIATPHSTHAELVCAAASAGKHVFVEKPLALTVAEAAKCVDACREAGVLLHVDHFRRRSTATRRLRALLDDGVLGEPQHLEAHFSRPVLSQPVAQQTLASWRNDPHEAPSGGMTALGVHMVDNLQYLAGPVARLTAMSKQVSGRGGIDDVTAVLLEFQSGPLGYLGTTLVVPKIATTAVLGTGAAAWSDEDGTRLLLQRRDEESRTEVPVAVIDPVADSVAAFVDSLRTGSAPETGGQEGLEVVAVLEAIGLSTLRGGAPVELDELRHGR